MKYFLLYFRVIFTTRNFRLEIKKKKKKKKRRHVTLSSMFVDLALTSRDCILDTRLDMKYVHINNCVKHSFFFCSFTVFLRDTDLEM